MTSPENTERSLLSLVAACSHAFGLLLSHEIAIRGAIAHGSFIRYRSDKGVFLAGRAIIDAYRFQQKQDWTGIMIAPSVLSALPSLEELCNLPTHIQGQAQIGGLRTRMEWKYFVQSCHSIPFHVENPFGPQNYDGFAVVPTDGLVNHPREMVDNLNRALIRVNRLKSLSPDPQSQKKHEEAIRWLQFVLTSWTNFAQDWDRFQGGPV